MPAKSSELTATHLAIAHILSSDAPHDDTALEIAEELLHIAPSDLHESPEEAAHIAHAIAHITLSDRPVEVELSVLGTLFSRMTGGVASTQQLGTELIRKGQYAVNAFLRVARAEDKVAALKRESYYHGLHLEASKTRQDASQAADSAAERYGPILGWHASMEGKDPRSDAECKRAHGRNFRIGAIALYPGQIHGGCFAAGTVISGPPVKASVTRWYEGDILDIRTVSGRFITVTPNHPILTSKGWVGAGLLNEGSYLACCFEPERMAGDVYPDEHQVPALIEDVARSFSITPEMFTVRVPVATEDFHGDGVGSEVCIIRTDSLLSDRLYPEFVVKPDLEKGLGGRNVKLSPLSSASGGAEPLKWDGLSSQGLIGGLGVSTMIVRRASAHHEAVRLFVAPELNASLLEASGNNAARSEVGFSEGFDGLAANVSSDDFVNRKINSREVGLAASGFTAPPIFLEATFKSSFTQRLRQPLSGDPANGRRLLDGLAGHVEFDRVVEIRRRAFSAHVYNLQTVDQWYIANGIIAHNCRCRAGPSFTNAEML